MQLPQSRTRKSVDQALKRNIQPKASPPDAGFLRCKYNSFSTNERTLSSLPDGKGKNVLTRDFRTVYDLSLPAGVNTTIRISPSFPYPVRLYSTQSLSVNSAVIPTSQMGSRGVWVSSPPLRGYPANWATNTSPGVWVVGDTSAYPSCASARITNVAYRLVYTGAAATADGLITVDALPETVDVIVPLNTAPITQIDPAGVTRTSNSDLAPYAVIDSPLSNVSESIYTKDQYVTRPENGLQGILKSRVLLSDHSFKPFWDQAFMCVNARDTSNALANATTTLGLTTTNLSGQNLWDDQLESALINVTRGGSYRLEVITCMETELQPTSTIVDLGRDSPYNKAVLDVADELNRVAKLNVPLGSSHLPTLRPKQPKRTTVSVTVNAKPKPSSKPKPKRKPKK